MYLPAAFHQTDPPQLFELMRDHPLATLITQNDDGSPCADHIPLLWQDDGSLHGRLIGHLARANPLSSRCAGEGLPVLAIFHGPQLYISPSGYATKAEHGRVVPTWNYAVVHVRGRLRRIDDPAALRTVLEHLTDHQEAPLPQPWSVADAPADYLDRMLAGVVGIALSIDALTGKFKLSQNQPAVNRESLLRHLEKRPDGELNPARAMAAAIARQSK